ncbi:UNVERIFIED_ORG: hypothetical protein J2W85_004437 [Ensifer adhaerens]|nr:hypothetical protein [Ensifer adhaerens]
MTGLWMSGRQVLGFCRLGLENDRGHDAAQTAAARGRLGANPLWGRGLSLFPKVLTCSPGNRWEPSRWRNVTATD